MRLGDGARDRPPEPKALRLGGEERINQASASVVRDAVTGVTHGNFDLAVVETQYPQDHLALRHRRLRHRVHRVDVEVDQELLQLNSVAVDQARRRGQPRFELDVVNALGPQRKVGTRQEDTLGVSSAISMPVAQPFETRAGWQSYDADPMTMPEISAQTVFVVDDDPSVLNALARLLRQAGWNVETYGSAESFLAQRDPYRPGCLVLDVALPGLDGLELQRRQSEPGQALPIVYKRGSALLKLVGPFGPQLRSEGVLSTSGVGL